MQEEVEQKWEGGGRGEKYFYKTLLEGGNKKLKEGKLR